MAMVRLLATTSLQLLLLCGCSGSRRSPTSHLSGQVLLPSGTGARGVEVIASLTPIEGEPDQVWLTLDEEGRFTHSFGGTLNLLEIGAGIGFELRSFDSTDLDAASSNGEVALGAIDLTGRVTKHRLSIRSADGREGLVRVAMWAGPPPEGVALGSRQFPPIDIGTEMEWLVPDDAREVYFLVERPAEDSTDPAGTWRTGRQQRFGPFDAASLPDELLLR